MMGRLARVGGVLGAIALASWLAPACSSSTPEAPIADGGGGGDAQPLADAGDDASFDDPPIDPKYQAFADAFDNERKSRGAPGAPVAILENGVVTFAHGFGTKGPNSALPVHAHTLFRIGSMTKSLTAATFLTLVDAGKLDPKATLKSVAPNVSIRGDDLASLTLHELLSQQSGLFDYLVVNAETDDSALETFLDTSLASHEYFMDPPGTFWNYANPNYYIAGLAVERAGGAPYRQVVHDRLLAPLGMARTFFLPSEAIADGDVSNGKSTDANGAPWDVAPDSYDNAWARPCGYAFSSVLDYARFVAFLNAGDASVMSDANRAAMQTAQVSTLDLGPIDSYGYGVWVDTGFRIGNDYYPVKLVHHSGDLPGFAADFYLVPGTGFGIVIFANADAAHFSTSLVQALQTFGALPTPTSPPTGIGPDSTTFSKLAGDYDDPNNVGRVIVSVDASNVVSVSMPDLDAAKIVYTPALTPSTLDNFVLAIEGTQQLVTFVRDGNGGYAWFRDRYFVAQRQAESGDAGADDAGPDGGALRWGRPPIDAAAFRARLRQRF